MLTTRKRTLLIILLLLNAICMVTGCRSESSISKLKEQLEEEKKKKEEESKKYVESLNRLYEEKKRSDEQEKLIAALRHELEVVKSKLAPKPQDINVEIREEDNFQDKSASHQKAIDKLTQIANRFYFDGDYAVAIEIYVVVVELGITDSETLFRLARCYGVTPESDKAISLYQKVIASLEHKDESNPLYHQAYNNLGGMYKKKGMYKEAELAYVKAIEINEEYTNAYYNLGLLYEENLDDELGAIACYERYIELNGDRSAYIKKKLDEVKARD